MTTLNQLETLFPRLLFGCIIGEKGCKINQIKSNNDVNISTPKDIIKNNYRAIRIEGDWCNIWNAFCEIVKTIDTTDAERKPTSDPLSDGPDGDNDPNKLTVMIKIPFFAAGQIIGKGGSNLKEWREKWPDCSFDVDKENPDAPDTDTWRYLRMRAGCFTICEVSVPIADIVESSLQKNSHRLPGPGGKDDNNRRRDNNKGGSGKGGDRRDRSRDRGDDRRDGDRRNNRGRDNDNRGNHRNNNRDNNRNSSNMNNNFNNNMGGSGNNNNNMNNNMHMNNMNMDMNNMGNNMMGNNNMGTNNMNMMGNMGGPNMNNNNMMNNMGNNNNMSQNMNMNNMNQMNNGGQGQGGRGSINGLFECNTALLCEDEVVGRIIGAQGSVIKNLRAASGCTITTDKKGDRPDGKREIQIRGLVPQVQVALTMVQAQIQMTMNQ